VAYETTEIPLLKPAKLVRATGFEPAFATPITLTCFECRRGYARISLYSIVKDLHYTLSGLLTHNVLYISPYQGYCLIYHTLSFISGIKNKKPKQLILPFGFPIFFYLSRLRVDLCGGKRTQMGISIPAHISHISRKVH
jgi:hypothetical protein